MDTQDTQLALPADEALPRSLDASGSELRALFAAMDETLLLLDVGCRTLKHIPTGHPAPRWLAADLIGQPLHQVIPGLGATTLRAAARQASESGAPVTGVYHVAGAGDERWLNITLAPIDDDARLLLVARDVTEAIRTQHEARSAAHTRSAFLASLGNEIRAPLNAIVGMAGLLLDGDLSLDQHDFVETIRQSGDTLLTTIDAILDFARIEAGQVELEHLPFDLRDCLEVALDLLAVAAAEKGLDLVYEINDPVPTLVVGDATRLRQLLLILLDNAVKFSRSGEIVVSIAAHPNPQPWSMGYDEALPTPAQPFDQELALPASGSWNWHELHIAVRDTGPGIPADQRDRLFRPFSRLDTPGARHYSGAGLGLAIARRLCELMGGRLQVESDVGRGSTFSFSILVEAQAGLRPASLDPAGLRGLRLLIVDESPALRQVLARIAEGWGLLVRATAHPDAALAWIGAGEGFDLALLDSETRGPDGGDPIAAIRRAAPQLPLVLLAPFRRSEQPEGVRLARPVTPARLRLALIEALREQPAPGIEPARPDLDAQLADRLPLRILLVEDNALNQKLALLVLRGMGYRADVAANGREALAALELRSYDVAVMDVQMPEMDGLEATRQICARWPAGRRPWIIALTANALQGDREICLEAGMDDYLAKPVRPPELRAALERAARRLTLAPAPEPSHERPTPPPLDPGVLAELRGLESADDPNLVAEMIEMFVSGTPPMLAELREAIARADAPTLRRLAHSLKSSAAIIGARHLAGLSAALERQGRTNELAGTEAALDQIVSEFARVRAALQTESPEVPIRNTLPE